MKNYITLGIICLTFLLFTPVYAQSFLTNGLVAYYPFDGNANDASGNGNNGTVKGIDWNFSTDRFGNVGSPGTELEFAL